MAARAPQLLRDPARPVHRELGQALLRLRRRQQPRLHRSLLGARVALAPRLARQPGHGRLRPHARHRHADERMERGPSRPVRQRPGRPRDPQRRQSARAAEDALGDLRGRRLGPDLLRPEEDRRLAICPRRQLPQPAPVLRHDQGGPQARPPAFILRPRALVGILQHPGRLFRPAVGRHEHGRAGQQDPGHRADDLGLDALLAGRSLGDFRDHRLRFPELRPPPRGRAHRVRPREREDPPGVRLGQVRSVARRRPGIRHGHPSARDQEPERRDGGPSPRLPGAQGQDHLLAGPARLRQRDPHRRPAGPPEFLRGPLARLRSGERLRQGPGLRAARGRLQRAGRAPAPFPSPPGIRRRPVRLPGQRQPRRGGRRQDVARRGFGRGLGPVHRRRQALPL